MSKFQSQLEKHCKSLIKSVFLLESLYQDRPRDISSMENDVLKESAVIYNMCGDFLQENGRMSIQYDEIEDVSIKVNIIPEGSGYRFVFNRLFPAKGNIFNASNLKAYTRTIRGNYITALRKAMISYFGSYPNKYEERVVIEIKSFYKNKNELRDYDNTESKPMIDELCRFFLQDDNPVFVALFQDYEMTEDESHCEMLIMPEKDFFLTKKST